MVSCGVGVAWCGAIVVVVMCFAVRCGNGCSLVVVRCNVCCGVVVVWCGVFVAWLCSGEDNVVWWGVETGSVGVAAWCVFMRAVVLCLHIYTHMPDICSCWLWLIDSDDLDLPQSFSS